MVLVNNRTLQRRVSSVMQDMRNLASVATKQRSERDMRRFSRFAVKFGTSSTLIVEQFHEQLTSVAPVDPCSYLAARS